MGEAPVYNMNKRILINAVPAHLRNLDRKVTHMEYQAVIGLEVHAQLKTDTKIFCGCSTKFGAPPNTHVCPVCLGMPGVLPVLNRKVVDYTIRTGLATNCTIEPVSRFARKNYFYPDLPKGYQISQYEMPIAQFGHIDIETDQGIKRIGITRIHMEEDAGKLIHEPGSPHSCVDYNRTGVPLMEIVSEPDLGSAEEAGVYLRKLHSIVRYIGVCDGNMEEGSFRCDANISIMPIGSGTLGTRAELKNLNSFRNVEKAITYEIARQEALIDEGGKVIQETRLWDPDKSVSHSMRSKEEAHDYRYFPDPDLLPLQVDDTWIDAARSCLPELPDEKRVRFVREYGLSDYDANVLTATRELAEYFESCLQHGSDPKQTANWVMGPLLACLKIKETSVESSPISPEDLANLVLLIEEGVISGKIAKTVFEQMVETGGKPREIVSEKGMAQVSDTDEMAAVVTGVIQQFPDEVAAYRGGKKKLLSFFMGQVMKETKGKANPKIVNQLLRDKL